nr:uncharacterized protein LOC112016374 [Quercus suber]
MEMGVIKLVLTCYLEKGQASVRSMKIGWNLRLEVGIRPPFDTCPTPNHELAMNIIAWNCRGALKPNFQSHVHDLVRIHDPAVFVVTETRVGGDYRVEVNALAITEQEIHLEVKVRSSDFAWLLSAIYASPRSAERCVLWENLTKVADLHNKPWIMAGDFNEPLMEEDKFGGRGVSINRSLMFKDCLDSCNMLDMGFSGPWCHSDHCPILIETHPTRSYLLNRPFRFQSFWLSDLSFPGIVSQAWINARNLKESITRFTKDATSWNKNQFGNIHGNKRRILARIYGVQRAIALNPSASLINFESKLHRELEVILD